MPSTSAEERRRIGIGIVLMTVAAIPLAFFFFVVGNPILGVAAVIVELGLFTAVRIALRRPARPVGQRSTIPRAR